MLITKRTNRSAGSIFTLTTAVIASSVLLFMLFVLQRQSPWFLSRFSSKPAFAHAISMGSTVAKNPKQEYRVLAYGDSLTAGTSGMELFPYAPHLERLLNEKRDNKNKPNVIVRHRGLPGWTAANMVQDVDGPQTGLRTAIRAVKNPPLSLVILLAGTNDLGFGSSAEEITNNILALHKVCYEEGVPRTIAIGIPPSGYQSINADAAALANTITANLQAFCASNSDKSRFHAFPFPFESNGENWFQDTLHFSRNGYMALGESLVDIVDEVLGTLDD